MVDIQHPTTGSLSPLKRPLALPAAAFVLGILAAAYGAVPMVLVLASAAGTVFLLITRKPGARGAVALIVVAVFFLGAGRYKMYSRVNPLDVSRLAAERYVSAVGMAEADPQVTDRLARVTVRVEKVRLSGEWIPASGRLLAVKYLSGADSRLALPQYGNRVALSGLVTLPPESSNPGDFSYRDYLARQRIYSLIYLRYPYQLRVLGSGNGNRVLTFAGWIRRSVASSLDRMMPQPYSGIAAGMALGTYSTLPQEIFDNFSRTSTLHLLAASGFNCAVVMLCALFVFRHLRVQRRWAYAAAIPLLLLYMLVVGAQPSIVRATIMASLLALAYILRRMSDPLNILFAAALVILACGPTDLFDVGFQLSFAAVVAIIVLIPTLQPWIEKLFRPDTPRRGRSRLDAVGLWLGGNLAEAVTATIAATLGTLPITAQFFNQFSVVSIPANAAVALLAPPVFVLSLIVPALAAVPHLGQAAAFVDNALIRLMLLAVNGFGSLSWSSITVASPGVFGAAGYYLIVGTAIGHLSRQTHRLR